MEGMLMKLENWERLTVTKIAVAVTVFPGCGRAYHEDRPYHGLVFNDSDGDRDYYFSDGTVLHTKANQLFYLPKGSTYHAVPMVRTGRTGCHAINFDAELSDEPFTVDFRSSEQIEKLFRSAVAYWTEGAPFSEMKIKRCVYDIILLAEREISKVYAPSKKEDILLPAIKYIIENYSSSKLPVRELSEMCGISEAYFRRLFGTVYGTSPKEYISDVRMRAAKALLETTELCIGDIAAAVGYEDSCHFSREFKKRVGTSPAKYRSNIFI
jgi:AraC-like DNA-binding protein